MRCDCVSFLSCRSLAFDCVKDDGGKKLHGKNYFQSRKQSPFDLIQFSLVTHDNYSWGAAATATKDSRTIQSLLNNESTLRWCDKFCLLWILFCSNSLFMHTLALLSKAQCEKKRTMEIISSEEFRQRKQSINVFSCFSRSCFLRNFGFVRTFCSYLVENQILNKNLLVNMKSFIHLSTMD